LSFKDRNGTSKSSKEKKNYHEPKSYRIPGHVMWHVCSFKEEETDGRKDYTRRLHNFGIHGQMYVGWVHPQRK